MVVGARWAEVGRGDDSCSGLLCSEIRWSRFFGASELKTEAEADNRDTQKQKTEAETEHQKNRDFR
jgi:hypothetical protein